VLVAKEDQSSCTVHRTWPWRNTLPGGTE